MKNLIHAFLDKAGFQIIRKSRSHAITHLTEARNVANHHSSMDCIKNLSQACHSLQLEWLIEYYGIDGVIDVGANTGQFAQYLRQLGYTGKIFSFEPMLNCFSSLQTKAAKDPNWQIFPFGLGSRAESLPLTRFSDDSFSSLHSINEQGQTEFHHMVEPVGTEMIEIRTLDAIWDDTIHTSHTPRILLKTDTQGHDLEVLKGCQQHLPECAVVLSEASFVPIYQGCPTYHEVFKYLETTGFECSAIDTLSYRNNRPSLIEANVLFINGQLTPAS